MGLLNIFNFVGYFWIYLILISFISALLFYTDKQRAVNNKPRISESALHFFELVGGVFVILFLMYAIRHKNRKLRYYIITYLILTMWIIGLYCYLAYC